ncbi:DnaA regulatory inactivator Hda [Candidatus Nitrotoga sp. M5]|uniref:DnaA regulatory inactivator Hda n=1 Tax=Candidatus Nitrotoga sp. M5 TaxID=2890409 RepID=UPI001EF3E54B|nr:DnaA regulatory inactivator Hda [Candidatus Nitrotoga sp. M5]CAH1388205.1 Regulatory inactivation of DnaA Hda protein [Candidatus Nitrotoga sp. M5]
MSKAWWLSIYGYRDSFFMTQLLLNIAPDWLPTLSNFVPGRNVELISALQHALAGTSNERCFYIWGEVGCGKSHLMQAIVAQARSMGQSAVFAQGTVPDMVTVIAVDDVEVLDDAAQIALFVLYNRVRESGGILLVSGAAVPAHLTLRDDLRTRLGWGLVYQVHALNDAEKMQALEQHGQARGFILPREVTKYLLRHGRRDMPALLGLLDALDAQCLRLQRVPSVPLLKEVMQIFNQESV